MEQITLPPICSTVTMPAGDHLEVGQEVTLVFHEIPTNEALDRLQYALEAVGFQTEFEWGKFICRIKVVNEATYQSKDPPVV